MKTNTDNKAIQICWILTFILFVACNTNNQNNNEVISKKSNAKIVSDIKESNNITEFKIKEKTKNIVKPLLEVKDPLVSSDFFSFDSYTFLETSKDGIVGSIDRAIVRNDTIFVLDTKVSKGIFVFKLDGKFLYSINKKGNGPGEINSIQDFTFIGDNIAILNNNHQIQIYNSKNGLFIEKISLPFSTNSIVSTDNSYVVDLFTNDEKVDQNFDYNLFRLDLAEKKMLSRGFPKPSINMKYNNKFNFYTSSAGTYFTKPFDYNIYQIDGDEISIYKSLDFGKYSLEKDFRENLSKRGNPIKMLLTLPYVRSIRNVMINDNFEYFIYSFQSKTFFYYMDKKENITANFEKFGDDVFLGAFNPIPIGLTKNKIMFVIEPSTLKSIMKSLAEHPYNRKTIKPIFDNLKLLSSKVENDSNPIIVFTSIKKTYDPKKSYKFLK